MRLARCKAMADPTPVSTIARRAAKAQNKLVCGVWRELTGHSPPPRPDTPRLPAWLLVVFNGFLVILGCAVLIGLITR